MNHPNTVRVQMDKTPDNPSGVVIINESDLTDKHVLVKDKAESPPPAPETVVQTPTVTPATAPGAPAPWNIK